jgi:predicted nucleic acid-binding protein
MPSAPKGRRVRIVVDTNTLVSGSLWSGNPGRLLDAVKAGKLTLLQTPQLWVEFVEVLNRPKFVVRLQLLGLTPPMLMSSTASHPPLWWRSSPGLSPSLP